MRVVARSVVVSVLTVLGVLLVGLTWSMSTTAILTSAPVALIMGGTGTPDPSQKPGYIPNVETYYLNQFSGCTFAASCVPLPAITPEQFWPLPMYGDLSQRTFDQSVAQGVLNLDADISAQVAKADPPSKIAVFGYSQSATIATLEIRNLMANQATAPSPDQLQFVLTGNPDRPNGGILARDPGLSIPLLGVTFYGATPTNSGYHVTDISFQYDAISDFPEYPLNLLADLNAFAGYAYIHGTYPTDNPYGYTPDQLIAAMNDPANQQQYNADTLYITLPEKNLPILQPLRDLSAVTGTNLFVTPVLDLVQPTLKTLVELGYDRTIPYGQPTTFGLIPPIDPLKLVGDLVNAAAQGVQAAVNDITTATAPKPATPSITLSPSATLSLAASNVPKASTPQLTTTTTTLATNPHNLVRESPNFSPDTTKTTPAGEQSASSSSSISATVTPGTPTQPTAVTKSDASSSEATK